MSYQTYPNSQDQRRIANANAKTLLQNWVEERAVENHDRLPEEFIESGKVPIKYYHHGHHAILSQPVSEAEALKKTTYKDDYIQKSQLYSESETKGIRYQTTAEEIRNQLLREMEMSEKMNDQSQEPISYETEVRSNYVVPGFVHVPPKPTTKHDLYAEMPVSYWTERKNRAHGVTQFKTLDSPFRKNAAFSTPVTQSYATAQPGELENMPYMSQNGHNSAAIL